MKLINYTTTLFFYLFITTIFGQSPGNVPSQFWIKADAGVEEAPSNPAEADDKIRFWLDQSNSYHCGQHIIDNQPTYRNNSSDNINYNPVVQFYDNSGDATDSFLELNTPDQNSFDFYMVVKTSQSTSGTSFWEQPLFYGGDMNLGSDVAFTIDHNGKLNMGGGHTGDFNQPSSTTINDNSVKIIQISRTIKTKHSVDYAWRINGAENGFSNIYKQNNGLDMGASIQIGLHGTGSDQGLEAMICEMVVFDTSQDVTNRDKIESYLALKYGVTLPNNYLNSSGTTIYNPSGFTEDIIGIGRDDDQGFLQKQSHTSNNKDKLYISSLASNNSSNLGSFSIDKAFIITGHNGADLLADGSAEMPLGMGLYSRVNREWKVQNSNFNGTFSIAIDMGPHSITASHLRLLVDADSDFSDATVLQPSFSISGSTVIISGLSTSIIPENSTRYITLASIHADTPLPVELKNLSVIKTNKNQVLISWDTFSEINNAFFTVERSTDKMVWFKVKEIAGAGNSSVKQHYAVLDEQPLLGNSYYRLKQTDYNGGISYSNILSVEVSSVASVYSIYPNPTRRNLFLTGSNLERATIRVFNVLGQDVTRSVKFKKSSSGVELDISQLTMGVYLVKSPKTMHRILKY